MPATLNVLAKCIDLTKQGMESVQPEVYGVGETLHTPANSDQSSGGRQLDAKQLATATKKSNLAYEVYVSEDDADVDVDMWEEEDAC